MARITNRLSSCSFEYIYNVTFIDRFESYSGSDYNWEVSEGPDLDLVPHYDAEKRRILLLSGDDTRVKWAHKLPESTDGMFKLRIQPIVKYPDGGAIELYLKQDENNFYKISNTDGYGRGQIEKVVKFVTPWRSIPKSYDFGEYAKLACPAITGKLDSVIMAISMIEVIIFNFSFIVPTFLSIFYVCF